MRVSALHMHRAQINGLGAAAMRAAAAVFYCYVFFFSFCPPVFVSFLFVSLVYPSVHSPTLLLQTLPGTDEVS